MLSGGENPGFLHPVPEITQGIDSQVNDVDRIVHASIPQYSLINNGSSFVPPYSITQTTCAESLASPIIPQHDISTSLSPISPAQSTFSNASTRLPPITSLALDNQRPLLHKLESAVEPHGGSVDTQRSSKPFRRRNKPSLSCQVCTVKKTKCDRERPICGACTKRSGECHYTEPEGPKDRKRRRREEQNPPRLKGASVSSDLSSSTPEKSSSLGTPVNELIASAMQIEQRSSTSRSLLSSIPFPHATDSNLFNNSHPFCNYWKSHDGLKEIMQAARPRVESANVMWRTFQEKIDAVYPIICLRAFQEDYEKFWAFDASAGYEPWHDDFAATAALIFVIFALATQFHQLRGPPDRRKTEIADFYLSASHQALTVYSYFRRTSPHAIQAMVFIIYYLMNANHSADAWAYAGILHRQSVASGLNRSPSYIVPSASQIDKQIRLRLFQAIILEDTLFCLLLKLPPNVLYDDCDPDDLAPFSSLAERSSAETSSGNVSTESPEMEDEKRDTAYIRGMWKLCKFIQQHICIPRALNKPIAPHGASQRETLIKEIIHIYESSFSPEFRTLSPKRADLLAHSSPRFLRQHLFLTSNYHHCLMLIHADGAVPRDGAMHAAHTALQSYFLFHKYFPSEASTWFHFQHRAYLETIVIELWLKEPNQEQKSSEKDGETRKSCVGMDMENGIEMNEEERESGQLDTRETATREQAQDVIHTMYKMLKARGQGKDGGDGENDDLIAQTRMRNLEIDGKGLWGSV